MNAKEPLAPGGEPGATTPASVVGYLLGRMLEASVDNADQLVGAVQRVTRELSSLTFNFSSHVIRSGMRSAELLALDRQLDEASSVLNRTVFDLQQRLLRDAQTLQPLTRIFDVVDLEDERPADVRLREQVDVYCEALEREYEGIRETLAALSFRLALMGNNIEIAACRAGSADVSAPVDLFCVMANQLRLLADRLRSATADLRIFQQSQNGYAESLRVTLTSYSRGTAA